MSAQLSPKKSFTEAIYSPHRKVEKVTLVWENINLTILTKDIKNSTFLSSKYYSKRVLRNVSGKALSGELLAIMGPTGM
jgi:ABC-type multidrug transport system fused ATPase/permease subunit